MNDELICCVSFGFEGAFFRFLLLVGRKCKREGIGCTDGVRSLKIINGVVENREHRRWRDPDLDRTPGQDGLFHTTDGHDLRSTCNTAGKASIRKAMWAVVGQHRLA